MRVVIITGSRSEWGLLQPLCNQLILQGATVEVIATGSHLSKQFGATADEINFQYDEIECLIDADTDTAVCKSMALLMIELSSKLKNHAPDAVIVLGDRFEIFAAVQCAYILNIPVIHLHGGEITGNYDNGFRWCVSEMASLHFPATKLAQMRLIKRRYNNVVNVGALGCEGLARRDESKVKNQILCVYHPVTVGREDFINLISALNTRTEKKIYICANADNGGRWINDVLDDFAVGGDVYISLPRSQFLRLLEESKLIIGNSSSGIIEAPIFGTYSINIGGRQNGREKAGSIIDVEMEYNAILRAIEMVEKGLVKYDENPPYKGGNVAEKMAQEIIKRFSKA